MRLETVEREQLRQRVILITCKNYRAINKSDKREKIPSRPMKDIGQPMVLQQKYVAAEPAHRSVNENRARCRPIY
jgi:hypothetical protein